MALDWIQEPNAKWDDDKVRIVGGAPVGAFDRRFKSLKAGEALPGDWFRVADGGKTVGYGWLEIEFGDAEITLATDPRHEGKGVGSFVIGKLESEAKKRGLNYVYNVVRPTHPQKDRVTAWLKKRGFTASEDGSLLRAAAK
jgi:ribosomal protein S18 acetylase RimI-like enzyme